ncbi:hypothetical protein H4R34_001165 [Dimargaris verticillata]|uniref:Methyltransferase-domain-containing protein n=1 Tax=Dimargaris verticillata TaxID=2761393 RepID=A0A9W8B5Y2_9FUNG|nr:hypothetical protein H4R34_001165 [Dimargaris verticillata]
MLPLLVSHPPASEYLRSFLKAYIGRIETRPEVEIHEALLNLYLELIAGGQSLLEPTQLPSYKTYTLDDAWCQVLGVTYAVTLQEEQMLVAKGTTGLRTWEASFRLTEYIIHHWADVIGTQAVLELGSGTGLLGITCALLASPQVTMTDFHPNVLALLTTNVQLSK